MGDRLSEGKGTHLMANTILPELCGGNNILLLLLVEPKHV